VDVVSKEMSMYYSPHAMPAIPQATRLVTDVKIPTPDVEHKIEEYKLNWHPFSPYARTPEHHLRPPVPVPVPGQPQPFDQMGFRRVVIMSQPYMSYPNSRPPAPLSPLQLPQPAFIPSSSSPLSFPHVPSPSNSSESSPPLSSSGPSSPSNINSFAQSRPKRKDRQFTKNEAEKLRRRKLRNSFTELAKECGLKVDKYSKATVLTTAKQLIVQLRERITLLESREPTTTGKALTLAPILEREDTLGQRLPTYYQVIPNHTSEVVQPHIPTSCPSEELKGEKDSDSDDVEEYQSPNPNKKLTKSSEEGKMFLPPPLQNGTNPLYSPSSRPSPIVELVSQNCQNWATPI